MPDFGQLVRTAAFTALAAVALVGRPAFGGDYDRNEVSARELAVAVAILPDDLDRRPAGPCTGVPTKNCSNFIQAFGAVVRGTARRHRGNLYVGTEAWLGLHVPQQQFSGGPVIGVGGSVGWESAADGFRRLRGYVEGGVGLMWSGTAPSDLLKFHGEFGMRYQVQQFDRPHTYLHIGARAMTNFNNFGGTMVTGVGWSFD